VTLTDCNEGVAVVLGYLFFFFFFCFSSFVFLLSFLSFCVAVE